MAYDILRMQMVKSRDLTKESSDCEFKLYRRKKTWYL